MFIHSGLDPAGPIFLNNVAAGLTRNSGHFVDVIHTGGLFLGIRKPLGHVDFYVNGGIIQPGCKKEKCTCSVVRTALWVIMYECVSTSQGFP